MQRAVAPSRAPWSPRPGTRKPKSTTMRSCRTQTPLPTVNSRRQSEPGPPQGGLSPEPPLQKKVWARGPASGTAGEERAWPEFQEATAKCQPLPACLCLCLIKQDSPVPSLAPGTLLRGRAPSGTERRRPLPGSWERNVRALCQDPETGNPYHRAPVPCTTHLSTQEGARLPSSPPGWEITS